MTLVINRVHRPGTWRCPSGQSRQLLLMLTRDRITPLLQVGLQTLRRGATRYIGIRKLELSCWLDEFACQLFELLNYSSVVGGRVEKDKLDLVGPGIAIAL